MSSCKAVMPTVVDDSVDKPSLEYLVKDYLTRKHSNPAFPYKGEATGKEWHDICLSSLEGMTDFICGKKNEIKAPDGPPYVFDDHQWYLRFPSRQPIVNTMAKKLEKIEEEVFADFEQLIDYVEARKVPYFGDTSVYDFSLRYGWNHSPQLRPKEYVYVHSKPRKAAKHLLERGYLKEIKKLHRKMKLEKYKELLLPGMTAHDVENFLCLYHEQIMQL